MNTDLIESSTQFRKVQKQMRRRVVSRKLKTSTVQVTDIGICYRARIEGSDVAAFGINPNEATQRLPMLEAMMSFCGIKACDKLDDYFEHRGYFHRRDPRSKRGRA